MFFAFTEVVQGSSFIKRFFQGLDELVEEAVMQISSKASSSQCSTAENQSTLTVNNWLGNLTENLVRVLTCLMLLQVRPAVQK